MPVFPALFAGAVVLMLFVESAAPLAALARPLVVAILAVLLLQAGLWRLLRERWIAAFFASLVFLAVVAPIGALLLAIAAAAPLVAAVLRRRRMGAIDWATLSSRLNAISVVLACVVVGNAAWVGALRNPVPIPGTRPDRAVPGAPDIYLLLLDGHPRSDTLARDFAFDDGPFMAAMEALGFEVSTKSRSNYSQTPLTLASVFNARHVHDLLEDPPAGPADQYRAMTDLIDGGVALGHARDAGYTIVAIPSPFSVITLSSADRVLDSGQVTDLELGILGEGVLPRILPGQQADLWYGQHRERIRTTFRRLAELASEADPMPRLVFAHVMAPHPPVVFAADGSPTSGWGCFPERCTMWDGGQSIPIDEVRRRTAEQVEYIQGLVLQTVTSMIANSDRSPVIVVFSDHGQRVDFGDREESLRNLLMARTPGRSGLFPDDATPINILPRLLGAYVDADLPMASEESYWNPIWRSRSDGFFPLTRIDVR